jgi:hypothetical protein
MRDNLLMAANDKTNQSLLDKLEFIRQDAFGNWMVS